MSHSYTEAEEKAFLSQKYQWHQYDVDLIRAYNQLLDISQDDSIKDSEPGAKTRIFELVRDLINVHCAVDGLNFELHLKHNRPIVYTGAESSYDFFLAVALVGFTPRLIKPFLNWQYQHYNGDAFFPTLVEFLTHGHVERMSPFDNGHRLDIIMEWVENNRVFIGGKAYPKVPNLHGQNNDVPAAGENKAPTTTILKPYSPVIEWKGSKEELLKLSSMLWEYGYTTNDNSFLITIKHKRPMQWVKEAPALAYLLCKLEYLEKIKSPNRGHFKSAELLFIYDLVNKVVKKSSGDYLKKTASDIRGRYSNKYKACTDKIDAILTSVFPK